MLYSVGGYYLDINVLKLKKKIMKIFNNFILNEFVIYYKLRIICRGLCIDICFMCN